MDDLDRYSFDTTGYLVVENALSPEEVQHMRAVIKEHGVEGGPTVEEQRFGWHGELLTWDQAFREVIDHPVVLDALAAFIGPQVRLDNAYGIVMEPGTEGVGLHGPAQPYDPAQYFRHEGGITRTGMLGFGWHWTTRQTTVADSAVSQVVISSPRPLPRVPRTSFTR